MTYPAQQQFAPQGFVQPAVQQQFAPQGVPAAVASALADPSNWTVSIAPDVAGSPVKAPHLLGRTIVVVPLGEGETNNPQNPAKPSKFIKCDIFVLDGPTPFYFGGSPNGKPVPIPDTMMVNQLPYLAAGTILFGEVLHDNLKSSIGQGVVVGKMGTKRTNSGNLPWCILPEDVTAEQLALANQLIQAHYRDRSFVNPTVQMLAGPQAQAAPQFAQQAAPAQYAPQPSWPQAQPGVVAQPMQYAPQPQFAAAPVPAMAAPFQPQAQFAPQAPAQQAPEVDWTLNTMPPGIDPSALGQWQALPMEKRLEFLAAAGITRPTGL